MEKSKVQYIRVSSFSQNEERQLNGMNCYIDKCSGSVSFKDRKNASEIIKQVEKGLISDLYVHSIDRLGRNLKDIIETIEFLSSYQVCLHSQKENIKTLNTDGSQNQMSKLLVGILGTISEFELNRIKERQLEGIAKAKENKVYFGRAKGSKESAEVFLSKAKNTYIKKLIEQGHSLNKVQMMVKHKFKTCSINSVRKVRNLIQE